MLSAHPETSKKGIDAQHNAQEMEARFLIAWSLIDHGYQLLVPIAKAFIK